MKEKLSVKKVLISIICISFCLQTTIAGAQDSKVNSLMQSILNKSGINSDNKILEEEKEVIKINVDRDAVNDAITDAINNREDINIAIDDETQVEEVDSSVSDTQEQDMDFRRRMESFDDGKFDYVKYNELRDVARFDNQINGTSRLLLESLAQDTYKFTAEEGVNFYLKDKVNEVSAIGPQGVVVGKGDGTTQFDISNDRSLRRRNAVISVSYDRIVDVTKSVDSSRIDAVFDIDLLFFIHSDNSGHFFKRVSINVDHLNKVDGKSKITVLNRQPKVPLNDTDFEVRSELISHKTILRDRRHNFTRVFPTTAGAVAARGDIDGQTSSMTLMVPGKSGRFKDFNITDSVLVKSNIWKDGRNTSSRTSPGYFKGRPFIGIIDLSMVANLTLDNRSNYVLKEGVSSANYGVGYREVGYHYQITDYNILDEGGRVIGKAGLKRTFDSHGCLRLQDHDLYLLYDVLNFGKKDTIPVEVKMKLGNIYTDIDSVYPRRSQYKKVVYSTKASTPEAVSCEGNSRYIVRNFGSHHTIADRECLSQIITETDESETLQSLIDYFNGQGRVPRTISLGDVEHPAIAYPFLSKNLNAVKSLYPPNHRIGQIQRIEDLDMTVVLNLYNSLQQDFVRNALYNDYGITINGQASGRSKWPMYNLRPGSHLSSTSQNFNFYQILCSGQFTSEADPRCGQVYNYLAPYLQ